MSKKKERRNLSEQLSFRTFFNFVVKCYHWHKLLLALGDTLVSINVSRDFLESPPAANKGFIIVVGKEDQSEVVVRFCMKITYARNGR